MEYEAKYFDLSYTNEYGGIVKPNMFQDFGNKSGFRPGPYGDGFNNDPYYPPAGYPPRDDHNGYPPRNPQYPNSPRDQYDCIRFEYSA